MLYFLEPEVNFRGSQQIHHNICMLSQGPAVRRYLASLHYRMKYLLSKLYTHKSLHSLNPCHLTLYCLMIHLTLMMQHTLIHARCSDATGTVCKTQNTSISSPGLGSLNTCKLYCKCL